MKSTLARLTLIARAEVTGGGLAGLAGIALAVPATALVLDVAGQAERLGLFGRLATLGLGVSAAAVLGERADSIAWSLPVPLRLRRALRVGLALMVVSAAWWALMAVANPGQRPASAARWLVELLPFFLAGVAGATLVSRLGRIAHPEGGAALPALLVLTSHFLPGWLSPLRPLGGPAALPRAAGVAAAFCVVGWIASGEGWRRLPLSRRMHFVSAEAIGAVSDSLPKGSSHVRSP